VTRLAATLLGASESHRDVARLGGELVAPAALALEVVAAAPLLSRQLSQQLGSSELWLSRRD